MNDREGGNGYNQTVFKPLHPSQIADQKTKLIYRHYVLSRVAYVKRYLPLLFFQLLLHWLMQSRLASSDVLICIKLTFGSLLNAPQMLKQQRRLPECFAGVSVTLHRK